MGSGDERRLRNEDVNKDNVNTGWGSSWNARLNSIDL